MSTKLDIRLTELRREVASLEATRKALEAENAKLRAQLNAPLVRNAISLLRLRQPVPPDVELVASDLEAMLEGAHVHAEAPSATWKQVADKAAAVDEEEVLDLKRSSAAFNAVVGYMLGKGRMEEPMEFLRCWNNGDFDCLRREWSDAPQAIYYADPLADHQAIDQAFNDRATHE